MRWIAVSKALDKGMIGKIYNGPRRGELGKFGSGGKRSSIGKI